MLIKSYKRFFSSSNTVCVIEKGIGIGIKNYGPVYGVNFLKRTAVLVIELRRVSSFLQNEKVVLF